MSRGEIEFTMRESPTFPISRAGSASQASIEGEKRSPAPTYRDRKSSFDVKAVEALIFDLSDPENKDFGNYELLEVVGRGGMSVVYRARQKTLEREVAVKLLVDDVWEGDNFTERLKFEARAASKLHHPNIVDVFDAGQFQGIPYIAMRLVRGCTLADFEHSDVFDTIVPEFTNRPRLHLWAFPRPVLSQVFKYFMLARWMRKVARAVHVAHKAGVLHLDLKPENILITDTLDPVIADFGIGRFLDSVRAPEGVVAGTPGYMSPEQANPGLHPIGVRSDIYALGAVLRQLLPAELGDPPTSPRF
jgi:serine/threonine protein kinase